MAKRQKRNKGSKKVRYGRKRSGTRFNDEAAEMQSDDVVEARQPVPTSRAIAAIKKLRKARIHIRLIANDPCHLESDSFSVTANRHFLDYWKSFSNRLRSASLVRVFAAPLPKCLIAASTIVAGIPSKTMSKKGLTVLGELEYLPDQDDSGQAVTKIAEGAAGASDIVIVTHLVMLNSLALALCSAFGFDKNLAKNFKPDEKYVLIEPKKETPPKSQPGSRRKK